MNKTDVELKQLAVDIYDTKVFTDRHINKADLDHASMVFMPIAMGAFSKMSEKEKKNVGLLYEYMAEAGPGSINGYPIFMSVQYLTKDELVKMETFYEEYKTMKESFLK